MKYDDFEILISSGRGGRILIRANGGAGEHSVQVRPAIGSSAAVRLLDELRAAVAPASPPDDPTAADARASAARPSPVDLARVGRRLLAFLLPPDLRSLWDRCRGIAATRDRGLRLRLHLDLAQRELAWLGTLPWELLYDEDAGGYLALDGRMPVVRYLDVRQGRGPFPETRPWRVLVLAPQPAGLPPLDLESERRELIATWAGGGEVELVFPRDATFDGIRAALRQGPIHGLHYMGHGVFHEPSGRAGLVIATESGHATALWGEEIQDLIKGVQPPALAVLNSCQTGRTGDAGGAEAFGGAAAALMRAGVPAVVAMQLPIGNRHAAHFSKVLYRTLQDRHPVDWAVSEARLSLKARLPDRPVWAVPSLYMRVADGRLFAEEEARPASGEAERRARAKFAGRRLDASELNVVGLDRRSHEGRAGFTSATADVSVETASKSKIDVTGARE